MIARKWLAPILSVLVLAHGVLAAEPVRTIHGVALQSTKDLDAAALNKRIAAAGGGPMARPVPLALELVGGSEETPHVSVEMNSAAAEDFSRVTVTVIRDGFLDDSVRGDWHEFTLARNAAGGWTVIRARNAVRCWRAVTDVYADRLCP